MSTRRMRGLAGAVLCLAALAVTPSSVAGQPGPPNILIAISDDQSYPYAGAYGCSGISTPNFDRVARMGALFTSAYAGSPGCSPSRAVLLSGRHAWELAEGGTHASSFPARYPVFPDLLEARGYAGGFTGKGWGPGNWQAGGRGRNPAGPAFQSRRLKNPPPGMSATDYAGNFQEFLKTRKKGQPFYFWYGGSEPHRGYARGAGAAAGRTLPEARVPGFLPDHPVVRSDILDYTHEIEHFDAQLGLMLRRLAEMGELRNTLVIVTADNGMAFPRAKANNYDAGIRVPLAISWPEALPGGRTVDRPVGFVDLTATIVAASGGAPPPQARGRSLLPLLRGQSSQPARGDAVFASRERHSSSRPGNRGYPSRAMRSGSHLYIRNFEPEAWPAGDPRGVQDDSFGFYDVDAGPTKQLYHDLRDDPAVAPFYHLAYDRRHGEELFDIKSDPDCLVNLAIQPAHAALTIRLREEMEAVLRETGDPRTGAAPEIWESYPRYSPIRRWPEDRNR